MLPLQPGLPGNPLQYLPALVNKYLPALISAATTAVLFVGVFMVIYLLGKHFVTRALKDGLKRQGFDRRLDRVGR